MDKEKFLTLRQNEQNIILVKMAQNAMSVLSGYPMAKSVAEKSLGIVQEYLDNGSLSATEISQYLDHEDMDQGLGLQIYNVDDDAEAIAAIDLACYATGAVSRMAFEQQGLAAKMPDPVSEAVPEVVVDALLQYQALVAKGLVPAIR